ncbi:MAG: RNA polymerase sigma factor [Acidimicrobiia bacterium]|nr:RNA polymerase sigma factor [Acidimicrobiia bacterium]
MADEFDLLIERYQRHVLMTAYRITGNYDDACDVAQEVFFRLYKYRTGIHLERDLSPWLYRATANACFDLRRRRPPLPLETAPEPPDPAPAPEENASLDQRRRLLHQALQQLPEKERAAVVLREIEGLSTQEVAEMLGSTETTVPYPASPGPGGLGPAARSQGRKPSSSGDLRNQR